MNAKFGLQDIPENFGVEILNNLIFVNNMFKERLTQNLIPLKFKELLAEKRREGLMKNVTNFVQE